MSLDWAWNQISKPLSLQFYSDIALLFITGHGGRQQYLPPTRAYDVGHGVRIRDNA